MPARRDAPVRHGTRVEWTPGRLEGHEHTNQLEIAPKTAADWERVLGQTISTAVEYYPIPVMLNGGPLARRDFLAGAMLVHEADGIRYGVYEEERNRDPLNVYGRGLLLAGMSPRVRTIDGRTFLTAIDIAGGQVPPLREPHRWELAETEAAEGLMKEGRLACLRAIAGLEQQPPLGYKDHVAATEAGIACRPAPARLLPWRGETVQERHHRWSPQSAAERVLATDGIVVERSFRQHEEATLVEAMRTSGNDAMLLERHYRLKGYPWYDRLPRLEHMRIEGRLHGPHARRGGAVRGLEHGERRAPGGRARGARDPERAGATRTADPGRGPAGAQDATREGVAVARVGPGRRTAAGDRRTSGEDDGGRARRADGARVLPAVGGRRCRRGVDTGGTLVRERRDRSNGGTRRARSGRDAAGAVARRGDHDDRRAEGDGTNRHGTARRPVSGSSDRVRRLRGASDTKHGPPSTGMRAWAGASKPDGNGTTGASGRRLEPEG